MNTSRKVIYLSVLFGLGAGVLDSAVDSLFFERASFWDAIVHPTASEVYIRLSALALFGLFGVVMSRVIAGRERAIAAGKEAEAALRKSEARLNEAQAVEAQAAREWQATFDGMSEGVAIISPGHRILRANLALSKMLGAGATNELVGQPCHQLVHGLDEPPRNCATCASLSTKRSCEVEWQEPHLGGRWLRLRGDPIMDVNGNVLQLVHTFVDITEEKTRQKALEQLHDMSKVLSGTLDLQQSTNLAAGALGTIFAAFRPSIGIALFDDRGQRLTVVSAFGPRQRDWEGVSLRLDQLQAEAADRVLKERRTWVGKDATDSSRAPWLPGMPEQGSLVAAPLVSGDRVIGLVVLAGAENKVPAANEMTLLETCVSEIALAVHNAQLFTRTDASLRRRIAEQEALNGIISASARSLDMMSMLRAVLRHCSEALQTDSVRITLLDESGTRITTKKTYQGKTDSFVSADIDVEIAAEPVYETMFKTGRPIDAPDVTTLPAGDEKTLLEQWGVRSALVLPIMLAGRALGTLEFTMDSEPKPYTPEDVSLAWAIANHLSSVMENIRLHERTVGERRTLESIISGMAEGLVVVDRDRRVAYFNRAAEVLTGAEAKNIVGRPVEVLQGIMNSRATDPNGFGSGWGEAATLDRTPKMEREVITGIGKRVIEATNFLVGDKESPLGIGTLLRDVTREREVDKMKSEFISTVSHELRTPMTAVYGFSELLLTRAKGLPKNQLNWVEMIHGESKRLSDIVEDLLDLSRIEAGRLSLNLAPVEVMPLAAQIVREMQLGHSSHSLSVDITEQLPDVQADRDKLRQVLYNLVDNAIKYSPKGGTVGVMARLDRDGGKVVVSVSDEGLGIAESEIPRLFVRFHRVEREETTGLRGTGLGLYIVKSLVEMMGGRIWVESQMNKGSTFHFSLPVAAMPACNSLM